MSETLSKINATFSRTACLEDFLGGDDKTYKNKYNKNQNDNIAKNQQHFGNRKRIKP